jgi:tripartite-type tricarboxylate transporter receptor subunit TctC
MLPLIESGSLRALAVSSAGRVPLLPDVPSVAESGMPGYAIEPWAGIAAPAGTPVDVIDRLAAALLRSLDAPALRALMARLGMIADPAGPAAFRRQIALEVQAQTVRTPQSESKIGR